MKQYGMAYVWGTQGQLYMIGVNVPGTAIYESAKMQHRSDNTLAKDQDGHPFLMRASAERYETEIVFTVIATTKYYAEATLTLPPMGSLIVCRNWVPYDMNGDWIYFGGGSIDVSKGQKGRVTLPVIRFTDFGATPREMANIIYSK